MHFAVHLRHIWGTHEGPVFRCRSRTFSQSKKSSCWRRRHLEELRPTQGEAAETSWAYRFLSRQKKKNQD